MDRYPFTSVTPLLPLCALRSQRPPLVCIPGAGASATTFLDFINVLGHDRPIYGLQPRGIDLAAAPHESVEAAALYNLDALARLKATQPIHLMGHSHGGLVAFEIALRLQEQGRPVGSLTMIDTEPPQEVDEQLHEASRSELFRQFVDALSSTLDAPVVIHEEVFEKGQIEPFLSALHTALVGQGCFPRQTTPGILRGSFAAFTAACRCRYTPTARYAAKAHLVLVDDKHLATGSNDTRKATCADKWTRHVAQLGIWHGPGNHFSILKNPHVSSLAHWWQQLIEAQPHALVPSYPATQT